MSQDEGQPDDLGVWITISELAKRKGVSRQSAREKVDRLERDGLIETVQRGRNRLVELVSYDRAVGAVGDAIKETGAATKRGNVSLAPAAPLRDAQTERAQYDAKLRALDYAERVGSLVAVKGPHGLEAALIKVTEDIIRDLGKPISWTQELMEKAREGEPAVRRLLRQKLHEQRQVIAGRLQSIVLQTTLAEGDGVEVDISSGDDF